MFIPKIGIAGAGNNPFACKREALGNSFKSGQLDELLLEKQPNNNCIDTLGARRKDLDAPKILGEGILQSPKIAFRQQAGQGPGLRKNYSELWNWRCCKINAAETRGTEMPLQCRT